MTFECHQCDPKYFVLYGICPVCDRRCEPPMFDADGSMSILDYAEFRQKWNQERAGLISDQFRVIDL